MLGRDGCRGRAMHRGPHSGQPSGLCMSLMHAPKGTEPPALGTQPIYRQQRRAAETLALSSARAAQYGAAHASGGQGGCAASMQRQAGYRPMHACMQPPPALPHAQAAAHPAQRAGPCHERNRGRHGTLPSRLSTSCLPQPAAARSRAAAATAAAWKARPLEAAGDGSQAGRLRRVRLRSYSSGVPALGVNPYCAKRWQAGPHPPHPLAAAAGAPMLAPLGPAGGWMMGHTAPPASRPQVLDLASSQSRLGRPTPPLEVQKCSETPVPRRSGELWPSQSPLARSFGCGQRRRGAQEVARRERNSAGPLRRRHEQRGGPPVAPGASRSMPEACGRALWRGSGRLPLVGVVWGHRRPRAGPPHSHAVQPPSLALKPPESLAHRSCQAAAHGLMGAARSVAAAAALLCALAAALPVAVAQPAAAPLQPGDVAAPLPDVLPGGDAPAPAPAPAAEEPPPEIPFYEGRREVVVCWRPMPPSELRCAGDGVGAAIGRPAGSAPDPNAAQPLRSNAPAAPAAPAPEQWSASACSPAAPWPACPHSWRAGWRR